MHKAITKASFLLMFSLVSVHWSSPQATGAKHPLTLTADGESLVRFFYQPDDSNYFHVALLFRVVEKNDPRWNTAPVFDVGRTAYISPSEMRQLITLLAGAGLSWDESTKVDGLETYKTIHSYRGMGIKVLSANGTAKATVVPEKICEALAPLDAALQTPRALWEFQLFRFQYHCEVPNFNPKAYPERVP